MDDDLLVTETDMVLVDQFFTAMHVLIVKDLGAVKKFLGMEVTHDDGIGYTVEQEQCIRELFVAIGLEMANSTRTPILEMSKMIRVKVMTFLNQHWIE